MAVAQNGTVNGGDKEPSKLRNALDTYLPIRNILTIGAICASVFYGGLQTEWYIAGWFNGVNHQLEQQAKVQQQTSDDLKTIKDLIAITKPQRDQQINLLQDQNGKEDEHLIAIDNRLSNIEKDMSRVKCRVFGGACQ